MSHTAHNLASAAPRTPPTLEPVATPARLLVPIPTERATSLRIGPVKRGDRLLTTPPGGSFDPRAPAGGTVERSVPGRLTTGAATAAALLVVDPAADDAPVSPPAAIAAQLPGDISPAALGRWIDLLRDAGVWAARSGSPDLALQLQVALARPIDSLICSLLDSDPTLPLQAAVAAAHPAHLAAGLTLLARLTGAGQVFVVIDQSLPIEYFQPLRAASTGARIVPIANDYPQADPTLLLYTLLDRRLRPGRLPAEQNALVLDAAAAVAVGAAAQSAGAGDLADQKTALDPALRVPVGVRDHGNGDSYFVHVPVGTTCGDLLDKLGLYVGQQCIVRGGDLLRDRTVGDDSILAGGELTLHVTPSQPAAYVTPCVRCGWCAEACPTRVQPAVVLEAAQRHSDTLARQGGIEACIECGVCTYVCPSQLPLLGGVRYMRQQQGGA